MNNNDNDILSNGRLDKLGLLSLCYCCREEEKKKRRRPINAILFVINKSKTIRAMVSIVILVISLSLSMQRTHTKLLKTRPLCASSAFFLSQSKIQKAIKQVACFSSSQKFKKQVVQSINLARPLSVEGFNYLTLGVFLCLLVTLLRAVGVSLVHGRGITRVD